MMKFATVAFVAAVINCVREGAAAPSNLTSDQTLLWTESTNQTLQVAAPSNGIDQTLSRLGDLVPVASGILNQEYIPLSDCQAIYESGLTISGLYYINPNGKGQFLVYCDMSKLDGLNNGWTLFQRRRDGTFDFNRNWDEYRSGFGNLKNNFWLGLDSIKRLTDAASYKLYIAVQYHGADVTTGQTVRYAKYNTFGIGSEVMYYKLSVGSYDPSSTIVDSLCINHNGKFFSTKDRDNDNSPPNCANMYQAGWWYYGCVDANLNGVWQDIGYYNSTRLPSRYGVAWKTDQNNYSFKTTVMAVRR
ncbi:hypothetical protein EMCRGX_G031224 [Ephydatia muelleri]|eukprot:Em0018g768a